MLESCQVVRFWGGESFLDVTAAMYLELLRNGVLNYEINNLLEFWDL